MRDTHLSNQAASGATNGSIRTPPHETNPLAKKSNEWTKGEEAGRQRSSCEEISVRPYPASFQPGLHLSIEFTGMSAPVTRASHSRTRDGPGQEAPVDRWSGTVARMPRQRKIQRNPCDRQLPGARLAWSEGRRVTTERSGVVTWAASPLMARVCD